MSIERKLLKKTARMLGVLGCISALCLGNLYACISPDLEPPGTSLGPRPSSPNAEGAKDGTAGTTANAGTPPAVDAAAGSPTTAPIAQTGGAGAGVPGVGANPTTPPTAGGASGAAGAASESDADAGVETP